MTLYVLRRLGWMVLTLWVVFTISFILMRSVPGGPFDNERKVDPEIQRNIEARYGLDQPLLWQYLVQLGNLLRFDLGPSFRLVDFSVNEVIAQGFPISASLGIFALFFALGLGLSAGTISALRRQSGLDVSVMMLATVGIALPNFVVAAILIIPAVFVFKLFPAAGWGTLQHLALPAFCLGAPHAAYIARLMRTGMLEILGQDYIRTAHAKGLSSWRIVLVHAMRGAMLPVISYLGPATAGVLTGSLVIEQIFAIPGLGMHFIQAATQRDYTLAMGLVLVYTTLLYSLNLLVDVSYGLLDPRVRL